MKQYAGIDLSLERSSVCVVDAEGRIVREGKVDSERDALIARFEGLGAPVERIGLEAGPLSQWLHAAMAGAGLAVGRLTQSSTPFGRLPTNPLPERSPFAGTTDPVRPQCP